MNNPRDVAASQDNSLCQLKKGDMLEVKPAPQLRGERRYHETRPQPAPYLIRVESELSTADSYGHSYKAHKVIEDSEELGEPVFVKTPRIGKHLAPKNIAKELGEITTSFSEERRNAGRIGELNRRGRKVVAEVIGDGYFEPDNPRVQHHRIPFLVSEYIDAKNMLDFLADYDNRKYVTDKGFAGITDPDVWFKLAHDIADIVRRIHNRQIVHGDIEPKNILIRQGGNKLFPIIVDFGQSFQLDLTSVIGSERRKTNPYVAPESRDESFDWYTPADIYSLGGVLFYMGTGERPPDIMALVKDADRPESPWIFQNSISWAAGLPEEIDGWKDHIQHFFSSKKNLIAKNEGIVKIVDKCLRARPADRYTTVERLLHGLDAVNYAARRSIDVDTRLLNLQSSWEIVKKNSTGNDGFDNLFANILSDKLELLTKEMEDMDRNHFEIYGEREELIDTLIKYMGTLGSSDLYMTVTVPDYWTADNLGINGRFLTVNKDLVKNGVFVNRLFLLSPQDLEQGSPASRVLAAHLKAWEDLDESQRATAPDFPKVFPSGSSDERVTGRMYVGFLEFESKAKLKQFQKQANHVAIWKQHEHKRQMSITFESQPIYEQVNGNLTEVGSKIVKVRFRRFEDPDEFDILSGMFVGPEKIRPLIDLKKSLGSGSFDLE